MKDDIEGLLKEIEAYEPFCEQEETDKELMLKFVVEAENVLTRKNGAGHFTASTWIVNFDHTKTLMVYHNIYNSWSWVGGHADGQASMRDVAIRETQEETGLARLNCSKNPVSLEILSVAGHMHHGRYVSSHVHYNLTYLVEADENSEIRICEKENSQIQWFPIEKALTMSSEPWMVEHIYKKLLARTSLGCAR